MQNENLIGRAEIERIERLGENDLDRLPIGAIRLDREGTILSYNRTEAELGDLAQGPDGSRRDSSSRRDLLRAASTRGRTFSLKPMSSILIRQEARQVLC